MKTGDLVKVKNDDGSIFGRGIFLGNDADLFRHMRDVYADIWVFHYEQYVLKPNTFKIKERNVYKIDKPEDW